MADIIDVLSVNENECNSLAQAMGLDAIVLSNGYKPAEVKNAAASLAEKIGVTIDLHTKMGAAWSNGKETVFANAIKVEPKTLTGAGDSWDAADIIGYLAGFDVMERLIFSNAYASLYIENPYAEPANAKEIFEFLKRMKSY
jgi:ribokinase